MDRYILALDQGTTSSRALVVDQRGAILSTAQREFTQILPAPGHVEHDPEEIWQTQLAVAREALAQLGIEARQLSAVGVTNQRETTILWRRSDGRPVANAIVWQSRITAPLCDRLNADGLGPLLRAKTGLVIDAYFSASKIKHLLDTVPGLRREAEAGDILFGTVDCFLAYRLTGRHVTDVSNASRTLLFNIHTLDWDDELLRIFDVPRCMLPEVRGSSEVVGHVNAQWLGAEVPLAGMAGDQQAATFGQACFASGDAKNTYGTGCFMLMNTGEQPVTSSHGLLTTIGWKLGDRVTYCLEGAVFIAGAVVQWLRDGLGIIRQASEVDALAAQVPDTAGVYLVPAFVGLGAPDWDPHARGLIIGLTRGTTAAHLARAALEALAHQTHDVLNAMQQDAGIELATLKVDGGASRSDLLMQFQADLLGVPVRRPKVTESTALGAAFLAGLAVGYWDSTDAVSQAWSLDREFSPAMDAAERARRCGRWREAVDRAKGWEH